MDRKGKLASDSWENAMLYMQRRNFGRAFAHFLVVIQLSTDDVKDTLKANFAYCFQEWTSELIASKRVDDVFKAYEQAREIFPNCEDVYYIMGLHLYHLGFIDEASSSLQTALFKNPRHLAAKEGLQNLFSHLIERWHFKMLNDRSRNEAFNNAITNTVRDGYKYVLDIGAGTGLLSMYALRAGAKRVYACEKSSTMYNVACDVLTAHCKSHIINFMCLPSSSLSVPEDIPRRVSLVVTETVDSGLLGEGILVTLKHAWEHLLRPPEEACVIPRGAVTFACLVECQHIKNMNRFRCKTAGAVDVSFISVLNDDMESGFYTSEQLPHIKGGYKKLSASFRCLDIDFNKPKEINNWLKGMSTSIQARVIEAGRCDAIIMWFDLIVDVENVICTSPEQSTSCWEQAVFPLKEELNVEAGDVCIINVKTFPDHFKFLCTKLEKRVCANSSSQSHSQCTQPSEPTKVTSNGVLSDVTDDVSDDELAIRDKCDTVCMPNMEKLHGDLKDLKVNVTASDQITGSSNAATVPPKKRLGIHESTKSIENRSCELSLKHGDVALKNLKSPLVHLVHEHVLLELNDRLFMNGYFSAISAFCTSHKDASVIDMCGHFSLFGLHAAKLGCRVAYCGQSEDSADTLTRIAEYNGIALQRLEFWDKLEDCGGNWDLLIATPVETSGALQQQVLEGLAFARMFCLKPTGQIFPECMSIYGLLIESDALLKSSKVVNDECTLGLHIAPFINRYQAYTHMDFNLWKLPLTRLTEPFKLFDLNFRTTSDVGSFLEAHVDKEVKIICDGKPTACVFCFDIQIDKTLKISTLDESLHWHHAAVVMETESTVLTGQLVNISGSLKNSWIDVYL